MFASLAPARRRLVVAVLALITAGLLALIVGLVAARYRDDSGARSPVPQGVPGPVVLVPGYGGGVTGLESLARVLRSHGRDAAVFGLPGDGRGDLDAQAVALARFAAATRSARHAATVDVVGYSAGGVVARLFVRDDGGAAFVRRVITLGSPHHGTDLAGLAGTLVPAACPTACQELSPDSALLRALNDGDETPTGPTYVSIWTTADSVVVPADSARLSGAVNFTVQQVCPASRVTHGDLPADAQVQAMVVSVLQSRVPQVPSRCGVS